MKSKATIKKITVYVDGTDWLWEVGEASDGNKVFPSIEALKEYSKCWKGCGIVKCDLVIKDWVVLPDNEERFGTKEKE